MVGQTLTDLSDTAPPLTLPTSNTYHKLSTVDEEDDIALEKEELIPTQNAHPVRCIWRDCLEAPKSLIVTTALLTIVAIIVVVSSFTVHTPGSYVHYLTPSQKNTPRPNFKDPHGGPIELAGTYRCGSFPSEAKSLGCVFDIMNYGWTASECYYEDLAKEALSHGPWRWFLDPAGTVEIPQDPQVLGRAVEIWTELGYHIEHCKYTQRLMQRAEEDDKVSVPQELAQRNHTKHCNGLVEEPQTASLHKVNTWVRTLYNPCIRLSELPPAPS